jgi:HK97 family phage portal protein
MGRLARGVLQVKGADTVYQRWIELLADSRKSKAGPTVTQQNVWKVSTALACMQKRALGVAQVPFKLFQTTQKDGLDHIRVARDHPIYDKIASKPNGWQTSFEFREQLELRLCLGNAFVFKNFYRGRVEEMFILNSVRAVQREDMTAQYFVRGKSGVEREVPAENIWHLRGLSWDGFMGMDVLSMATEALGLTMALDESAAALHANGIQPAGLYSVDKPLSKEQHAALLKWVKTEALAKGDPLILDNGAKWHSTVMSSVDAQHREMRDQQVAEVCRFFNVLPTVIGHTGDKANTFASTEAMLGAHKAYTLAPEYVRIQESADINLLTDAERAAGYYFKFITPALMLASTQDQGEFISRALGSGGAPAWMTQDEARALFEMNPFGGDAAKLPPITSKTPAPAPNP